MPPQRVKPIRCGVRYFIAMQITADQASRILPLDQHRAAPYEDYQVYTVIIMVNIMVVIGFHFNHCKAHKEICETQKQLLAKLNKMKTD
jgi:hypothetical protein